MDAFARKVNRGLVRLAVRIVLGKWQFGQFFILFLIATWHRFLLFLKNIFSMVGSVCSHNTQFMNFPLLSLLPHHYQSFIWIF